MLNQCVCVCMYTYADVYTYLYYILCLDISRPCARRIVAHGARRWMSDIIKTYCKHFVSASRVSAYRMRACRRVCARMPYGICGIVSVGQFI